MNAHLERLARKVAGDPFFLAAPLARYADAYTLDDAALAARLGCDTDTLTRLRLCRNPDPRPPRFFEDVTTIATRFGVDPDALADAVRLGHSLLAPGPPADATADASPGYLMAARDGEPSEGEEGGDDS